MDSNRHWQPLPPPPGEEPEPTATSLAIAKQIWKDCLDRRGIKWECRKVDDEVRDEEIFPAWQR